MAEEQVFSAVKDKGLVEKRRKQMIKGALNLFKEKGFHRTTTREIAKESGFSIGTLYEYIRTKEDVLFLVCDSIYDQVQVRLEKVINVHGSPLEKLVSVTEAYFRLMDEMQEEIVIMYQEVKSLKKDTKEYVLQKEREMVQMLEKVIVTCLPEESISSKDAMLMANNIFIQGQMWSFRRWMLQRQFTLDEYIERQTQFILRSLSIGASKKGEK
ncbi:TetR family transcriptional regulator [Oceanobacillus jordanicus]|uniref:TetR/AcrR family transcriptional regulator n=1 Tax=Oceanobacillus jordanicus TaxID=2867266 RepID=A0AAW5AYE1_9BACI|nr:TetR/AcrR family transcriptional regulator [Oceanobacillus jordanicus]NAO99183.1 TetR family transcriptional regulator [Halomonas sp. MG34]